MFILVQSGIAGDLELFVGIKDSVARKSLLPEVVDNAGKQIATSSFLISIHLAIGADGKAVQTMKTAKMKSTHTRRI
ncbi:hypothetical protein [Massilia sp. YIM B04103]|uniref:hypothetical protein n=1 Tax=Massilia sp. YIM B04103 TaxID=2963106 RepID=UPI00210E936C|nr:hypothetical protein [Massilia sp. YIM B04103]